MHILSIWLSFSSCLSEVITMTCGIDKSPVTHVYEGTAKLETYPWLGVLYYPYGKKRFTTAVVLVTRQIVLAAANEIDKLPKANFRTRARVVLGHDCRGTSIGVRDYTYHPDYSKDTYSTLAMVQLEIDHARIELRPICPPPSHFKNQNFIAMVLSDNCKKLKLRIYKMKYVSPDQCKAYYRRSGLNLDTLWPAHTACAKTISGGHCIWRSGAVLVVKLGRRWRLLGFGVYGPGCQAPARFLDYGMYHEWVQRSVARIGRPAITALADNHLVLRRKHSAVQRFGPCDPEETIRELYTDTFTMVKANGTLKYNVSIISDVEYSCVTFIANSGSVNKNLPKIRLRRWCTEYVEMCSGFGYSDINFYVEISFLNKINFTVKAYGRNVKFMDPVKVYDYLQKFNMSEFPNIISYNITKADYLKLKSDEGYPAFGKKVVL